MDKKDADKLLNSIYSKKVIKGFYPSKNKFKKHLKQKQVQFFIKVDAGKLNLHLSHTKNFFLLEQFRQMGYSTSIQINDIDPFIRDSFVKGGNHPLQANLDCLKKIMGQLIDFETEDNPCIIELLSERMNKQANKCPIVEICGQDKVDEENTESLNRILEKNNQVTITLDAFESPNGVKMSSSNNVGIFVSNQKGQQESGYRIYTQIISANMKLIHQLLISHTDYSSRQIEQIIEVDSHLGLKFLVAKKVCQSLYGDAIAKSAALSFEQKHLTCLE